MILRHICLIIIISFLSVISSIRVNAQSTFPTASDSVSWAICYYYYSPISPDWSSSTFKTDMIEWDSICGYNYSVVWMETENSDTIYIRNEGDRVYIRTSANCSDKEYLLYDFSLTIGDTVFCGIGLNIEGGHYYISDTAAFWVEDIDTIWVQDVDNPDTSYQEKVMFMKYGTLDMVWGQMGWQTGLGSDEYPFYAIETAPDYCECARQTVGVFDYDTIIPEVYICDYEYIGIEELQDKSFQLFPNPTHDKLSVQSQTFNTNKNILVVSDLVGTEKLRIVFTDKQEIDLAGFSAGIYLVSIENEEGIIQFERIIKE